MPKATISRCGGSAAATYPQLVASIGGAGNLLAYWRLGETTGLFEDTSNFNHADPADALIQGPGSNVRGVAGALGPTNDDGAWQITSQGPSTGLNDVNAIPHASENPWHAIASPLTVVAWIIPEVIGGAHPDYRGAILNSSSIVAGAPSYEFGWGLCLFYAAGATQGSLRGFRSNNAGGGGLVQVTTGLLTNGTKYMASYTFDGATLEIGLNAASFVSVADTDRGITLTATPQIGEGVDGMYTGVVDDVSVWHAALSHAELAQLYALGSS